MTEENKIQGWIKLYRSMMNKGYYKKSEYVHLWLHILLKASFSEREQWFNGKSITLKEGQFITGRKKLSEETGIEESKVERILTYLEKIEQQIEQQKSSTSRIISIKYWNNYQQIEQQIEQRVNNECTTSEHYNNNNNNNNNGKKEEELNNNFSETAKIVFEKINDEVYLMSLCSLFNIRDKNIIISKAIEFAKDRALSYDYSKTVLETRDHFKNWLRKMKDNGKL